MKIFAFFAALFVATATGTAHAQDRHITVNGTGSVEAAPDMATLSLGVTTQADEAAAAMRANSQAVAAVLSQLDQKGIEPRDIQTRNLSVAPIWSGRPQKEEERRITGFVASNRVFVRVRDLDHLGEILDAVISKGANDLGGLSFALQEPEPLAAEARARAVADASEKARQLAEAAGVTLGRVISIDEHGGARPVMRRAEMAMADAGNVPVAPGEISVEVSVSMVFEIAD
ncbi:hypothetical protein AVO45_01905 [Ruegeria marisrubri]|uniref:SIMPL domain-containing protein n=1 Tax=Ruegeria marisrubri TaxID=1685379 RepID=A0A101CYR8_9RHOB|nr:SIMPL domain-containing protein [Ruegeria marisrubri]KUJ85762.1 hypothetical protein AVO45_01905 [Ruegeria marisrubri]